MQAFLAENLQGRKRVEDVEKQKHTDEEKEDDEFGDRNLERSC